MSEEPVEILVQMAEKGEIDPWNIDIVEVTDRFLAELDRRRELDLRISGRTLFYSSVLLRMKSEYLDFPPEGPADDEPDEDMFAGDTDPFSTDEVSARALGPIELLEREIDRRIKRKDARKRPVTLYELITQLKLAEKAERRRQRRKKLPVYDEDAFPEPDADDVVGIAHDEAYDAMAQQIYALVVNHPDARDPGVSLFELVAALQWPLYQVYIPCLFLMLEGMVELEQDEFFGDLWVVIYDGSSEENREEK
jgi:segregation and condensation protein A